MPTLTEFADLFADEPQYARAEFAARVRQLADAEDTSDDAAYLFGALAAALEDAA